MAWYDLFRSSIHSRDVVLTGIPRSGTTLVCKLLSDEPDCIALNEPIRLGQANSRDEVVELTRSFFKETRKTLLNEGWAFAKAAPSGLVTNHFGEKDSSGKRKKLISRRRVEFDKSLSPDFWLFVKHNAAFTLAIRELMEDFKVFATVREPLAVLLSWNSVDIPVSQGRLRKNFNRLLGPDERLRSEDLFVRQVGLLDWYFTAYKGLPRDHVLRYEDVVGSSGRNLSLMIDRELERQHDLSSRNRSSNYEDELKGRLREALFDHGETCWHFYDKSGYTS
jgi:hypothetical protein